jgi:hypothetical protein
MKEIIKEKKNQGFKKQNYYNNNRNFYGKKIFLVVYQLVQAIQKIIDI